MSAANGMVSMDDREVSECLKLVRESISGVIDLGTEEDNAERPGWAMDVLQNLRYIELQLEKVLPDESTESEAAE
jgi:hypothetical protein